MSDVLPGPVEAEQGPGEDSEEFLTKTCHYCGDETLSPWGIVKDGENRPICGACFPRVVREEAAAAAGKNMSVLGLGTTTLDQRGVSGEANLVVFVCGQARGSLFHSRQEGSTKICATSILGHSI